MLRNRSEKTVCAPSKALSIAVLAAAWAAAPLPAQIYISDVRAEVQYGYGSNAFQAGRLDEAVRLLESSYSLLPHATNANLLSCVYADKYDVDQALRYAQIARNLAANDADRAGLQNVFDQSNAIRAWAQRMRQYQQYIRSLPSDPRADVQLPPAPRPPGCNSNSSLFFNGSPWQSALEMGTDRSGEAFDRFALPDEAPVGARPEWCMLRCMENKACKSFTFTRVDINSPAWCALRSGIPDPVEDGSSVSATWELWRPRESNQ